VKGLIVVVIVVLIGYGFVQSLHALKAKNDFAEHVDQQLDFVSDTTMDSVKQDLIADAKKLDIDLAPADISITYEDTEQRTLAQGIVGARLDVQFFNKRVEINVNFVQHILGIPFHGNIIQSKIRQIQAPRREPSPEMKQLLESAPQ
jgi:hypothetical protein